jgi:hypothetical protein
LCGVVGVSDRSSGRRSGNRQIDIPSDIRAASAGIRLPRLTDRLGGPRCCFARISPATAGRATRNRIAR